MAAAILTAVRTETLAADDLRHMQEVLVADRPGASVVAEAMAAEDSEVEGTHPQVGLGEAEVILVEEADTAVTGKAGCFNTIALLNSCYSERSRGTCC
jgi:hypothetical protein